MNEIRITDTRTNLQPDGIHEYAVKVGTGTWCTFTACPDLGAIEVLRRALAAMERAEARLQTQIERMG
jgi:hypothetical protein